MPSRIALPTTPLLAFALVSTACSVPGSLLGGSAGGAVSSPSASGDSASGVAGVSSGDSSGGAAPAGDKAYDCRIDDWDKGLCGGPTEADGTITREQALNENPPPKGKLGRTVLGPVGFGKCRNPGKMDNQLAGLPSAPADPWIAVDDHKVPAALPLDAWQDKNASVIVREDITGCTAAHDHCLRDCTWFIRDVSDATAVDFSGIPVHRRSDGVFTTASGMLTASNRVAGEIKDGYVAYRTVPATKRLVVPGRLAAAMQGLPDSEKNSLSAWTMAPIEWVDFEAGTVKLEGGYDVYLLSSLRVVVLTSKNGGPVEITPGLSATDIVVKANEVYLP